MHALVQRATREHTPDDLLHEAARAAADALMQAWPAIERDPALGQALRANATTLHTVRPDPLWTVDDGAHSLLFQIGNSLGDIGQVIDAADPPRELAGRSSVAASRCE